MDELRFPPPPPPPQKKKKNKIKRAFSFMCSRRELEQELAQMLWKINYEDIEQGKKRTGSVVRISNFAAHRWLGKTLPFPPLNFTCLQKDIYKDQYAIGKLTLLVFKYFQMHMRFISLSCHTCAHALL